MRVTRTWTISLPPDMSQAALRLARAEHRTKSELVREALRLYFAQRGQPLALGADVRLSRVGELAELYRQRASTRQPSEAQLRRSFRGVRQLHERLKHLPP
ncbi:MAG: ribbon-helix-helix protein, CopG family [Candidatus Omnitrophica bacterium]|nr:ribbon-helix-helix protein, CopG family [Candidatus Omnitrophota bacterium]